MTKQDEIREGIARAIHNWHVGNTEEWDKDDSHWFGPKRADYYEAADMVLTEESYKGVVIKVEKSANWLHIEPLIKEE